MSSASLRRTRSAQPTAPALARQLLTWYDAHHRELPWRQTSDPYAIWVSEIMLQQTRVAAVVDRYDAFLRRFPTVAALASASEAEVLALWSGLGYYRRARMLHEASRFVMEKLGGNIPSHSDELRKLPGVGAYTAAAIASIAHGERIAVVDGNVERVLCRVAGLDGSRPEAAALRREIQTLANRMVPGDRPGDFNQAMMELGATVCLPRNPQCLMCPLAARCATRGEHPTAPRARMQSRSIAHALCIRDGRGGCLVLLEQRPSTETVMPGMWELPPLLEPEASGERLRMKVSHAIMQVNYSVQIQERMEDELPAPADRRIRRWVSVGDLTSTPLTGLTRKVLTRAQLLNDAETARAAKRPASML